LHQQPNHIPPPASFASSLHYNKEPMKAAGVKALAMALQRNCTLKQLR
jgi:hypothetical protein